MASQFVKNMSQKQKKKEQVAASVVAQNALAQQARTESLQGKTVSNIERIKPSRSVDLSSASKTWNSTENGGASNFVKSMAQSQREYTENVIRKNAIKNMRERFKKINSAYTDSNDSFMEDTAPIRKKTTVSSNTPTSDSITMQNGVSVNEVEKQLRDRAINKAASKVQSRQANNRFGSQSNSQSATFALSDTQKANMPKGITVKGQDNPNARVIDQAFKEYNENDSRYQNVTDEKSYRNTKAGAYAYKHPLAGAASHVINNMGSGIEGLAGTAYQFATGKKLDDSFYKGTYASQDSQSGIRRRVQDATGGKQDGISTKGEKVAGFLADTGMSMLDSAANRTVAGAIGLGEVGGLAMMSGAAGAGQLVDLNHNDNVSARRAAVDAAANTAFEYLSEKISWEGLDAFKDMEVSPHNMGEIIKRVAQQAATEGGEEVFSTLTDAAADSLILGNEAEYVGQYNAYKDSGMSNSEAMKNVVFNLLKESALSFAGGAISGGVMGAGATGLNYMNAKANQNFTSDQLRQTADAIDTSTQAYTRKDGTIDTEGLDHAIKTAEKLPEYADRLDNGDILTFEDQQDIYKSIGETVDSAAQAQGVDSHVSESENLYEMVNDMIEEVTAQEEERTYGEPISMQSTPEEAKASTEAAIESMNLPANAVDETAAEPVTDSQRSRSEQLAAEIAQNSAQNVSEEASNAEPSGTEPVGISDKSDDFADVNNMVSEESPVKLPTIEDRAKQYTGKAKEIYENGFDGNDILTYDENMAKVYNAAAHGETLNSLMVNDEGFQSFFQTYAETILPFYDEVYLSAEKARNSRSKTKTDSQTLGGSDYGNVSQNVGTRDEGAVRNAVEVREGDLGGSDPVRTEQSETDGTGRQSVSDTEEVRGSDAGSVSGSSGRGVSGQRSVGSSAGNQVPDYVGGVTITDTTQSDRFTVKNVDGNYYVWDNLEGKAISSAYPVHEAADRVLNGIRNSSFMDRYSVKKTGNHEYYIWDNENDVAVSRKYPAENLAKFALDERRMAESENNKVPDSGEKTVEQGETGQNGQEEGGVTPPELVQSAQDLTENVQKDTENVQNGTENVRVASDNDRNITESAQKTEQNVPKVDLDTEKTGDNSIKTDDNSIKTDDNSIKTSGNSIKTSGNSIKTSENSIKGQGKKPAKRTTKKAPKEAVTVEEQAEQKKAIARQEKPKGNNYTITEESAKSIPTTPKARLDANIDAVKTLKDIMAGNRIATAEEQAILANYTGWGGIGEEMWQRAESQLSDVLTADELAAAKASITDAYYTDPSIITGIYKGLQSIGFNGGKLLEPSAGVGRFIGAMPSDMIPSVRSWTAVELDTVTGNIAKALYPGADVRVQGFEKAILANGYMDAVVGNVPFGEYGITDKRYPSAVTSKIHNYFIARSLDTLRPGGVACLITSSGTMDAKGNAARKYISKQADLIGAIRLPNTAFKGTGTSVTTDILVFQKREANTPYRGEQFVNTDWRYATGDTNQYFLDHPDMVLGTPKKASGQFGRQITTYEPLEGKGTLEEQITKAFQKIERKMEYPKVNRHEETVKAVKEARNKKQGTAYKKDGKLYKNDGGLETEVNLEGKEQVIYESSIEIRDTARELVDAMLTGKSDADIQKLRDKLNKQYDNFVAKYPAGFHSPSVKKVLRNDTDYAFLQSLEKVKGTGRKKTVTKNDIFTRNTVNQAVTVTSVNTVSDGIEVSLNELGYIDPQKISDLMRKPKTEIESELDASDLAYRDADGNFVSATTYLSGNVRAKLKEAQMLVENDATYQKNVDALKKVVPKYKHGKDISVNLGVTWIPAEYYGDFAAELMGGEAGDVTVTYSQAGGYDVTVNRHWLHNRVENTKVFGNKYKSFLYVNNSSRGLFYDILNNRDLTVKVTDLDGKSVPNLEATEACKELKSKVTEEFNKWLWKDENRRTQLEEVYNDSYNAMARAHYDSNVTISGQTADISLRDHQGSAINRIVQSPYNTLLQHGAGAGKTFAMIGATKKLRELGIAKKPVIVVPKSKVGDWISDYYKMFPTANVLVADDTTFATENRKEFTNRIATTDVDAIIMSKEQFQKIPMSEDYQKEYFQSQIDEIIAAEEEQKANRGANKSTTMQMEKRRKSLATKLEKLADAERDTDNITFEETGIDYIFVDEAQAYKNLAYTSNLSNVADMGKPDGNQITFDMKMKTDFVRNSQDGKGIVFGTATPVMNSPVEAYAMLQYLCPEELKKRGIYNLDNFIDMFGRIEGITRQDAVGRKWINRNSFTGFNNMGAWQQIWGAVTDSVRTEDVPGIALPAMKGGDREIVMCQAGPAAREAINGLADRLKSGDRKGKDHVFALQSDGKKASFSQRMIDPSLPYGAEEKVPMAVSEITKIWKESATFTDVNGETQENGVQLVFCDFGVPKKDSKKSAKNVETNVEEDEDFNPNEEFFDERVNVYQDMKDMLVANGIPAEQIAFIHDATNDVKRNALYEKVRSGEVRVLIGSAKKMGEGLNVQDRIVALHEMNPLARPGDIEQVEARAIRQGNLSPEVAVKVYVTEDTFDTKQWDTLRAKSRFISEITSGTYEGDNAAFSSDEFGASAGDIMAVASGNPLLKEQADNNDKLRKLEGLKKQHDRSIYDARVDLDRTERHVKYTMEMIPKYEADVKKVTDLTGDNFSAQVGKKTFDNREEFGEALIAAAKKAQGATAESTKIGFISGFDIYAGHEGGVIQLVGEASYGTQINMFSSRGTATMVTNAVKKVPDQLKYAQASLKTDEANIPKLKEVINSEFSKAEELEATRKRAQEIEQELLANNADSLTDAGEGSEGAVYARKLSAAGVKPKAAGRTVKSTAKTNVQTAAEQMEANARPQDWTAEKNKNSTVETPKELEEIIGRMRHDFKFNLDVGYVRGEGVTGQYNTRDKGLRIKTANTLPTVSHEFGHWLDDKYSILKGKNLPRDVATDFQKAFEADPDNKDAYDPSVHKAEGVAEFVRYYLTNKDTAKIDYPAATEYVKKSITNPKELALFEHYADEINAYYAREVDSAAGALVYKENRISDYRTLKEKIRDSGQEFYQNWVDDKHGVRLLDMKTGGNAYIKALEASGAGVRADEILTGDILDIDGNFIGPGLGDALYGINLESDKDYRAINEYLVLLHGQDWIEQGKRVFADDRMNNVQFMKRRLEKLDKEYPNFADNAQRIIRFTQQLTYTYAVKTGLISEEQWSEMLKANPHYVPFFRAGFKNKGNSLAKSKGSGRSIIMPIDNIMDVCAKLVKAGVDNDVLLEIRKASMQLGADATFLERLPDLKVPKKIDVRAVKQELYETANGLEMAPEAMDAFAEVMDGINDFQEAYMRRKANPNKGEIVIMVDGKPEYWKINNPLLLDSILSLTPQQSGPLLQAYGTATRFITANITGNNAIWSVGSNSLRDLQTAIAYAKEDENLFKVIKGIGSSWMNSIKAGAGKQVSPYYREYLAMGGGGSAVYLKEEKRVPELRRQLNTTGLNAKGRKKLPIVNRIHPLHPFRTINELTEPIQFISEVVETGPRFAVYEYYRKSGSTPAEAFYESQDRTVYFKRGGKLAKQVNKVIPFFNAGVQATDKYIRHRTAEDKIGTKFTGTQRAKAVFQRFAFGMALTAIAVWVQYVRTHKDEETKKAYNQLSNYVKNTHLVVPTKDGEFYAFPTSHELGNEFAFFSRLLEYKLDGEQHAFDDLPQTLLSQSLPSIVSDVAAFPINVVQNGSDDAFSDFGTGVASSAGIAGTVFSDFVSNKDYLGRPIESSALQKLNPNLRYDSKTSALAYHAGQITGVSPKKIDYAGKNILGGIWTFQNALFPIDDKKGTKGKRDWSFGLYNTYNKDSLYSQDLTNWMYDKADESAMNAASYKDDKNYAVESKLDSDLKSYYSKAYGLVKDNAENPDYRVVKQSLLDSIKAYQKKSDNGSWSAAEKTAQSYAKKAEEPGKVLPGVLDTTVKVDKKEYQLTGREYIQYQKTYEQAYWKFVKEQISGKKLSDSDALQKFDEIKKTAKDIAEDEILTKKKIQHDKGHSGFNSYKNAADDKKKAQDPDSNLSAKDVYNLAVDYAKANGFDAKTEYYNALSDDQKKKYDEWEKYGGTFDTYDEYLGTRDFTASKYTDTGESVSGSKKYKIAKYLVEQVQNHTLSYNQAELAWELNGYNGGKKQETLDDYYGSSDWYKMQNTLGY